MNRCAHEGEPLPKVPSPPLSQFPPETPLGAAPNDAEQEEPIWWVDDDIFGLLGDAGVATYAGIDRRGPYRTGWTKAELRLATALIAARRENETLRDVLKHAKEERLILAKLCADEPQFFSPLEVYAAKKIRDLVLNAAATPEPR